MNAKCNWCDDTSDNLTEVFNEKGNEFICPPCRNITDIGFCCYCEDSIAYYMDDLDNEGLCPDHKGESDLDENEKQDWGDYLENINKDG